MKDNEIAGVGNFTSALDWEYSTRTGTRWNKDPKPTFGISPYTTFLDNPIQNKDPNGDFSINNHYDYTKNALKKLGYSNVISDLVAHYASVYADHPSNAVMMVENQSYRKGIDYSKTKESQNTKSPTNSTWHSMKADKEPISNAVAKARGQAFGWDKIISASTEIKNVGGIDKLKENSPGLQDLGQGIHALQDAIAHQGVDMKHHSVWNDMYPSQTDAQAAERAAKKSWHSKRIRQSKPRW